jgi:ATP-binding protein involved in chromosome partitioning
MPPGTGDVQMGVAKLLPRAEVLVVTTPARGAQKVASRAVCRWRARATCAWPA